MKLGAAYVAYRRDHDPSDGCADGAQDTAMMFPTLEAHEDVFNDSGRLFFRVACYRAEVTSHTTPVVLSWLPLCTDIDK